jgi:hypothetical protein
MNRIQAVACVCAAAALTAACEKRQSSNPLSPTVAGPIPWVKLTTPHVVNPAAGQRIRNDEQPITLILENASTNGPRPLSYLFEVATDVTFTNRVFVREGVAPGEGGRTSIRLPDPLAPERTYYWRARAEDGANTGEYTAPIHFAVYTPVVIQAPVPRSPIGNTVVNTINPRLTWANAPRSGPASAIGYVVEISSSDAFATIDAVGTVPENTAGETSMDVTINLVANRQYFWRVRAYEATTSGPWAAAQVFTTATAAPPAGGGGAGGGGGGTGSTFDQLGNVIIVGGSPDVRGWAVTSQITQLGFANHMIYLNHTKLGQWPGVDIGGALQESTLWVFFKINGQWYATGAERWRPNQTEKTLYSPTDISTGWFYNNNWSPMWNYIPSPGEQVGFMVVAGSTRLDNNAPVHERSNILLIPWPATTPAYFP